MRTSSSMRAVAVTIGLAVLGATGLSTGCEDATGKSISGSVKGAVSAGVTVALSGAGSSTATTDATGGYAFAGLADGSYTVTPSLAGYAFEPASRAVTVSGSDVGGQDFLAARLTFTIAGTVSGDAAEGVTVTVGGAGLAVAVTTASGGYVVPGLPDGTYTITPSLAGYTFEPASRAVTVSGADVGGQDFVAARLPHAIAGTVSGSAGEGVTMTLSGGASASTVTDASGGYAFAGLADAHYAVTPSLAGTDFDPPSRAITLAGADAAGQDFTATPHRYAISGRVSGAVAQGVLVTLGGDAAATARTDATGHYAFGGLADGGYLVTPSLDGFAFDPASLTVTVAGADVGGKDFAARPLLHLVSGTVSGVVRQGITVTLSGAAGGVTTTDAAGYFAFAGLGDGTYVVTPSLGGCAFEPASQVFTVSGADVLGLDFTVAGVAGWRPVGAMSFGRQYAAAARLPDGRVLVVGGIDTEVRGDAEIYDPGSQRWAMTAPLASLGPFEPFFPLEAVPLHSGRVFVGLPTSAEVHDPGDASWRVIGPLPTPRNYSAAALLHSGEVLVAGGMGTAVAELWDPATGLWRPAAPMTMSRHYHTATTLPSGQVLVAAGHGAPACCESTAELYDPATDTWSATGSLAMSRVYHTATLLPSGRVLVVGGMSPETGFEGLASAELYDPATGAWSPAGTLAEGRYDHTATLLPSGQVLVAGGARSGATGAEWRPSTPGAELYDPVAGTWTATAPLSGGRSSHVAALLASGEVLVAGGAGPAGPLASAEVYTAGPYVPPTHVPHAIAGTIGGDASGGVTVTLGGAASAAMLTGPGGHFAFYGLADGAYSVTPSRAGFTFSPASRAVALAGADVLAQDFTATAIVVPHAISGTVTGVASAGVTVTLAGKAGAVTSTDTAGHYAFPGLLDGSYTVTPFLAGTGFVPVSRAVTLAGADVTGQDFVSTVAFSISGTVSGVKATGVTIKLTGARTATTTTDAAGRYGFQGLAEGSYTVTPSYAGTAYTFDPTSRTVAVSGASVSGQDFTSAAATCTVGGTPACNDNNICTTDTCDPARGCLFTPKPNGVYPLIGTCTLPSGVRGRVAVRCTNGLAVKICIALTTPGIP